jgi:hypothetical protein
MPEEKQNLSRWIQCWHFQPHLWLDFPLCDTLVGNSSLHLDTFFDGTTKWVPWGEAAKAWGREARWHSLAQMKVSLYFMPSFILLSFL